jgi:ribosomal protein S18 acetylase RimI-like enzyme
MRSIASDEWSEWRTMRLRALVDAPSAFSSTLDEWQGDGDTEARWRERLESVPFNVLAFRHDDPVGMVSGALRSGSAELMSMWVEPSARGRGVGDALVDALVRWAALESVDRISLCVFHGNDAAIGLYRRHAFVLQENRTGPVCSDQLEMVRKPTN